MMKKQDPENFIKNYVAPYLFGFVLTMITFYAVIMNKTRFAGILIGVQYAFWTKGQWIWYYLGKPEPLLENPNYVKLLKIESAIWFLESLLGVICFFQCFNYYSAEQLASAQMSGAQTIHQFSFQWSHLLLFQTSKSIFVPQLTMYVYVHIGIIFVEMTRHLIAVFPHMHLDPIKFVTALLTVYIPGLTRDHYPFAFILHLLYFAALIKACFDLTSYYSKIFSEEQVEQISLGVDVLVVLLVAFNFFAFGMFASLSTRGSQFLFVVYFCLRVAMVIKSLLLWKENYYDDQY